MIPFLHGVWSSGGVTGDFEHIETITVGAGGSASVTFSSIASTYKHLQIRYTARTTNPYIYDDINIRFNSDTGNNYARHTLYGDGSAAASNATTTTNQAKLPTSVPAASIAANIFGSGVIDLLDYASTSKYKTLRALYGYDTNGGGQMSFGSSLWMSSSAITSVQLYGSVSTNIVQHSTFSLYGIK